MSLLGTQKYPAGPGAAFPARSSAESFVQCMIAITCCQCFVILSQAFASSVTAFVLKEGNNVAVKQIKHYLIIVFALGKEVDLVSALRVAQETSKAAAERKLR